MGVMMAIIKMFLGTYWLFVFWNVFFPFAAPMNTILPFSALALVGIHVFELLAFAGLVRQQKDNKLVAIVMILLFGIVHINELRQRHPSNS